MVDPSLLAEDMKIIRERRGENAMRFGDEVMPIERIPMISPTIMRVTDGGIPIGRITRLWGDPSTGKTHVAYLIMAAAQKYRADRFPAGLQCCYWNVEGIYDAKHAAHLGVNTKALALEETKVIEDIAGEMNLMLRSCHLHVIDSASAATCIDELAAKPEDWQRALDARAWKRALKRIESKFDADENVVVMIDHASETQGQFSYKYAKGGRAMEFASSMSLQFIKGSWLYYHPDGHLEKDDKIKDESGVSYSGMKEADGIEISVRCNKSRVGRPLRAGKMRLDLNTFEFDTTFELLDAATFFDDQGFNASSSDRPAIIQRTGAKSSWFLLPDGRKVQGGRGIREEINQNAELAQLIRTAMLSG